MTDERNDLNGNSGDEIKDWDSWGRPEDFRVPGGGLFGEDFEDSNAGQWSDSADHTAGNEPSRQYDTNSAGPDEDTQTGSVTGNGRYRYSGSDPFDEDAGWSDYYSGGLRYGDDDLAGGNSRGTGKRTGRRRGKAVLAVALAAVFGLCAGLGAWGAGSILSEGEKKTEITDTVEQDDSEESPDEELAEEENTETAQAVEEEPPSFVDGKDSVPMNDISNVAEFVMPSIVSVYNNYVSEEYYFGQRFQQEATSTGSGIIIATTDSELLIVTNNHVVAGTKELKVRFIDNSEAEANLKGTDEANDLAVIAVPMENLSAETQAQITVATLGNSETLKVGQDAIAIGNALGYGQSVTRGIISAVNREISDENGITGTFIQTDAAINPGNSGGALVDINGQVIGINSSKIGGSQVEGMGFAIPISEARPIIEELMTRQTRKQVASANQGTLGISGTTVTSEAQVYYGLPGGVYVVDILQGGAAQNSELQKGDVITEINGTPVKSMEALKKQLEYYEAGTTVTLTIQRRDETDNFLEQRIEFTLGSQEILNDAQGQDEQEQGYPEQEYPEGSEEKQDGNGFGGLFDGQRPDTGRGFDFSGDGDREFGWPFGNSEEDDKDD